MYPKHLILPLALLLILVSPTKADGRGAQDLILQIPDIQFKPDFLTYSGYLYANSGKTWKMHYVLTTSRSNKTTDPVVFWFNGGPGCSSLTGSFQEMGPMYVDEKGLFENVYSWNRVANMVYLESPIGVGFSYDTKDVKYHQASDNQTADQNFNAILDFFSDSHPEYKDRDFYLAGESYAGIYIPTLAAKLATSLSSFPNKNFKGLAIGNAYMNPQLNLNTQVLWGYYHGMIGEDDWKILKDCCRKGANEDVDECDWYYLSITQNQIDFKFDTAHSCGRILDSIINPVRQIDPYNFFQDCYETNVTQFRSQQSSNLGAGAKRNPATYFNRQSTDPNQGYACYNGKTAMAYFNRSDFAAAFNIDKEFYTGGGVFQDCNDAMGDIYQMQYSDMTHQFELILSTLKHFKILILNGDIDMVCNFIGDARFVRNLGAKRQFTSQPRVPWYFRKRVAGYVQRYTDPKSLSSVDVLTIKGAGHMNPMDRPGPSLQMFARFLDGSLSYGDLKEENTGVPDSLPYVDNIGDTGDATTPKSGSQKRDISVGMFVLFLSIFFIDIS